jgi:hypothetical protein
LTASGDRLIAGVVSARLIVGIRIGCGGRPVAMGNLVMGIRVAGRGRRAGAGGLVLLCHAEPIEFRLEFLFQAVARVVGISRLAIACGGGFGRSAFAVRRGWSGFRFAPVDGVAAGAGAGADP